MKFIDKLDEGEKAKLRRHKSRMPFKCHQQCYPASYHIGANDRGRCVGLIDKADDLDCLRLCIFHNGLKGELELLCFHMTPDEAIDIASGLLGGVDNSLALNSNYVEHLMHMREMRDNGNMGAH